MNVPRTLSAPWSTVDVENLESFLKTATGRRFLARLTEVGGAAPSQFPGEGSSVFILGQIAGSDAVKSELIFLSTAASADEATQAVSTGVDTHYPDLDRNEGWAPDLQLPKN